MRRPSSKSSRRRAKASAGKPRRHAGGNARNKLRLRGNGCVDQQREQAAERQRRQVDASTRKRETVNDVFKDFQDRQDQNRRDARDRQFEENERQLREAVRRAETEPDEEWEKLIRPDAEQQRAAALQRQQLQAAYVRQEAQRRQDELNRRTQEEYDSKLAAARAARLAEEQRLANLPPQPLLDEPLSDLLPDGPGSLTEAVEFAGRVISESAARLADALVAQVAGGEFPDLTAAARSAAGGAAAGLPRDLTRGLLESAAENSPPEVAAQYRALRYVDQLSEFNETFQRREFHALP